MSLTLRRLRGESGQILAIAVVFLALFGLAAVATLGWTTASLRLARATGERIDRVYTADAGIDYAIEMLRRNQGWGVQGDLTCYGSPRSNGDFNLPPINGIPSNGGTVHYEARPNSGTCLPGAGTPANTPPYALFTRSGDPSTTTSNPLDFTGNNIPLSPSVFQVKGDVYAAAALQLNQSAKLTTLTADALHPGNVRTHNGGACPAGVTVPPSAVANCNLGSTYDAVPSFRLPDAAVTDEDDPATMELGDPNGTAVSATETIFSPGRYVDPPVMNQARLYVFDPGLYYFDFLADGSGSDTWTVGTAGSAVVGGALSNGGWSGPTDPIFPGACDTAQVGVQFLFGASSRLVVGGVRGFELCPFLPTSDGQHVAVYGVHDLFGFNLNPQGDLASPGASRYSPTLDTTVGGAKWKTPQKAYSLGRKESTISGSTNGQTLTHEWSGFVESDIPAGATVTKIIGRPVHRESGNAGYSLSIQAFVSSGVSTVSTAVTTVPNNLSASLKEDALTMPLTSAITFTDNPSNRQQLRVRYSITKTTNSATTAYLDWIPITVAYTPPGGGPEVLVPTEPYDSPTAPIDASGGDWSSPEKAFARDDVDASMNLTGVSSSTQEWWGYSEFLIPAGAQIVSLTAYPRHREDGASTYRVEIQAVVKGGDDVSVSSPTVEVPQNNSLSFRQDEVSLPLASLVPWLDKSATNQIKVRVTLTKTGSTGQVRERIDWLPITVAYRLPWRASSGCVKAETCALLDTLSATNELGSFLQGTYYAPQGRVVARTAPFGQAILGRGAIAKSARFEMRTGQALATVTQVPPSSGLNVAGREIEVTVDIGTSRVRALVGFDAFTRLPTVRSWYVT